MANINGTSNGDFIQGTAGADVIDGLAGNDTVSAAGGDDQVYGRDGIDLLDGGDGNDVLDGGAGNDDLRGQAGIDLLDGGDGDDRLDGGSRDTLRGGAGKDQLILTIFSGEVVSGFVDGGDGTDMLNFANYTTGSADIVFSLSDPEARQVVGGVTIVNVEQASFVSGSGNDILIGGSYYDELIGGAGNDVIDAGGGNDRVSGGIGMDILRGGAGDDEIFADVDDRLVDGGSGVDRLNLNLIGLAGDVTLDLANDAVDQSVHGITVRHIERLDYRGGTGADRITGGAHSDFITGGAGDDVLRGGDGNDTLDGHGGIDQLFGGAGDDTISSIETSDAGADAILDGGEGIDFLELSVTPLGDSFNIDILTPSAWISGFEQIRFTGGFGFDTVSGGNLGDVLQGRDGNDVLSGRDGDDYLSGDNGNDRLDGGAGDDNLIGGAGVDELIGGNGDDRLDGVEGADRLVGGAGDDTYTVNAAGVTIVENADEGIDLVMTSLSSFSLEGTNLENLSGQFGGQLLTGNAFANRIDGGPGADTMAGLGGDDTYCVDNAGDVVREVKGGGYDTVVAYASYALASGVEVEALEARNPGTTAPINLTGNELANRIIGEDGNNLLQGGGGNDWLIGAGGNDTFIGSGSAGLMEGGTGDDVYFIFDSSDLVIEGSAAGSDRVAAGTSYTLDASAQVETLEAISLAGTAALNFTGNAFAQTVIGNSGANILDGKGGADVLIGAGGADTFAFTSALGSGNVDRIDGFASGEDKIGLDDAIFTAIVPGALAAGAFFVGSQAADADDRIIYDPTTGALFYDPDGIGAAAQVQFATLSGAPPLVGSDFALI